jgi:hypothetical protein
MGTIASLLQPVATVPLGYAERLLKEVTPESFASKPELGGKVIELNHPAFNYGHLALYPERIARYFDLKLESRVPAGYEALFKDGTPCHHDPERNIYPAMDEITACFLKGSREIVEKIALVSDDRFHTVMDDEKRRQRFPTVGAFVIYLLSAHVNGHLGQVSAWRRCMGLPPA